MREGIPPTPRVKAIHDQELLKTLWGRWGGWSVRILSTVIKKMYFSIHFFPKKAFAIAPANYFSFILYIHAPMLPDMILLIADLL